VTAYVSKPGREDTVTLEVPDGFKLLAGAAQQAVPSLPRDAASPNSPVTWKVRAPDKPGRYVLRVRASSAVAQSLLVTIRPRGGIFD
jgi:hypothetical protein